MNKRPWSVTVIGCIFLAAGVIGLAFHATEFKHWSPFQYELVWVSLVRLLAIICGVYLLRAHNWARWLALIWLAYHVILSAFHSTSELLMHSLLLAVIAYFLFRMPAAAYFRNARNKPAQTGPDSTIK